VRKNFFLYSQEYRDQKIGGKKRAKQFFQKFNEKCGQKMLGKNRPNNWEKRFLYSHEYRVQKI